MAQFSQTEWDLWITGDKCYHFKSPLLNFLALTPESSIILHLRWSELWL